MEIAQAKLKGVAAFEAGLGSAPALNAQFLKDACASKAGDMKGLSKLFSAYTNGWTFAMLAKDCDDPQMPSVIELARIKSAAA